MTKRDTIRDAWKLRAPNETPAPGPRGPAIFDNTGQAIHVAFTIMSQAAQQDSVLRKSLVRILGSMNNLSPQLEQWLDQLRGTPSSTVNFEGLSANDVRAQCAMILAAVRTKLPEPEMWAIHAKYAATEHEETGPRLASGEVRARRYAFSAMKIHAIEQLVGWLVQTSALREVPLAAMKCMVAKFYSNHAKVEISFRALAQEFGGNHMLYARTYKQLVVLLRPLEILAVRRLEPYFLQQGIVGDQQACTV